MISEDDVRRTYEYMKGTLERHGFHVESLDLDALGEHESFQHLHMMWQIHLSEAEVRRTAVTGSDPLVTVMKAFQDDMVPGRILPAYSIHGETGRVASFHMSAPMNACVQMLQVNKQRPESDLN